MRYADHLMAIEERVAEHATDGDALLYAAGAGLLPLTGHLDHDTAQATRLLPLIRETYHDYSLHHPHADQPLPLPLAA